MFNNSISLMSIQERNELIEGFFKRLTGVNEVSYTKDKFNRYASTVKEGTEGKIYWKASMEKGFEKEDMPPAKIESLSVLTTLTGKGAQPKVFTNIELCYGWKGASTVEQKIEEAIETQKAMKNIILQNESNYKRLDLITASRRIKLDDIEDSGVCANIEYGNKLPLILFKDMGMIIENSRIEASTHIDRRMEKVIPCLDLQIGMLERSLKNE